MCFYFHTNFGCPPRSSRKNHRAHCLRSCTFRSLSSLSGLSVYWNNIFRKIQTTIFCVVLSKPQPVKSRIGISPGWKTRIYFQQRIHFCIKLTFQFSCLKFSLISFQLPSFSSKRRHVTEKHVLIGRKHDMLSNQAFEALQPLKRTVYAIPFTYFTYWSRSCHLNHLISEILGQRNIRFEVSAVFVYRKHINKFEKFA